MKILAVALTEPEMNIAVDMLKYAKDIYSGGADPIPDMLKLMESIIVSVQEQLKNQPDNKEQPKGLIQ